MLFQEVIFSMTSLRGFTVELLILLALFCAPSIYATERERNIEKLTGIVVAYDDVKPSVTCIDVCETSLIVRINGPNETQPRYIRVVLRFRDRNTFPKELIRIKKQWRFMLLRTSDLDEPINEFLEGKDFFGKEFKHPIWKLIGGAESERLPFGAKLPSYSLAKNGFKPIRGK